MALKPLQTDGHFKYVYLTFVFLKSFSEEEAIIIFMVA
jgi:hypothetical protein